MGGADIIKATGKMYKTVKAHGQDIYRPGWLRDLHVINGLMVLGLYTLST